MDAKTYLALNNWDVDRAVAAIKADKKDRPAQVQSFELKPTSYRAVFTYNHNREIVSVVVLACNTDFVGKSENFLKLGHDLCLQVVGTSPASIEEMLEQDFVKDTSLKIKDCIAWLADSVKENIVVQQIERFDMGENLPADPGVEERAKQGNH